MRAAVGAANVKALVYVAAFAPDAGDNLLAVLEKFPSKIGTALMPDAAGGTGRIKIRGFQENGGMFPGLSLRSNPGLELANAFGVFIQVSN